MNRMPPSADKSNSAQQPPLRKLSGQSIFLAVVLILGIGVAGYIVFAETLGRASAAQSSLRLEDIPFDGAQAYTYLKQICDFGPRPSGTPAMAAQQKFLIDYFQKLGATVTRQEFRARHPLTGDAVPMTNLIIQ